MESRYFIVKATGKAKSHCPGSNGELVPAVREGSVWADTKENAIEIYKFSHEGYFVGAVVWDARPMTDAELVAWEKDGIFPTL